MTFIPLARSSPPRLDVGTLPLLDIQRQLAEVGRIRMGATEDRGGRRIPIKLETWRLTSRDRSRVEDVARLYGGTVEQWNDEWEVVTTSHSLDIMLIPGQNLSQYWELWGQTRPKGPIECLRRCDGEREIKSEQPCLCPADHDDRRKLAQAGKACKPTSRLSVMLANAAIGSWRLDTRGVYAAMELQGATVLIERANQLGILLPARLRLDPRSDVRDGQSRRYAVPVIDLEATPNEFRALEQGALYAQIEGPSRPALPPAASPPPGVAPEARAEPPGAVDEGAGSLDAPQADLDPSQADVPRADDPAPTISQSERGHIFRLAREKGLMVGNEDSGLREVLQRVTGQTSTAGIPKSKYDELKKALADA